MLESTSDHPARSDTEVPEFSVLVTCHYEEQSIDEFYSRLSAAMKALGRSYEIVMVNDGSTDGTFDKLKEIFHEDPKVTVVMDFYKNAGQQAALAATMCEARGKAFLFMDSDLQLAPEDIHLLVTEYDKGFDVVGGYRKDRKDSLLRIVPSKIANMIMRKASQSDFRDFGCTFWLCAGDLLRGFELGPFNVFSAVDLLSKVERWREVPVSHHPRKYGESGWTFRKLWKYNMDNIVTMSERPFQILGAVSMIFALLFVLRLVVDYFTPFQILDTVTTGLLLNAVVVSSLLLVAILCAIGEFAIRSFISSRHIPKYIIREIMRKR
jgi:dolichol-phosphate mannosyltransferase